MWPSTAIAKLCSGGRRKAGNSVIHLFGLSRVHSQSHGPCAAAHYATRPEKDTERRMLLVSFLNTRQGGRLGLIARSFGCSSSIPWTHDVEEDFEAEPCKHSRNYSNHAVSDVFAQKMSIRIEPPMAGILDKELLRKRRTQPFTEMQSLGVGLYRDKLRNCRCFSTAAMESSRQEEHLGGSGTVATANLSNKSSEKETTIVSDENLNEDGEDDEIGIVDSDSEEEEDDYRDRSMPSISSMIKEQSIEALEASLKAMEKSLPPDDLRIGTTCLRLAQLYDSADEDPEDVLPYAEKALKILQPLEEGSFDFAMCHHVLGSTYYKMDESEKAISYLEQAADLLEKVREAEASPKAIGTIRYAVQILLGHSKMALEKQDDGLENYQKALAINEQVLEPGNPDLARSYQQVAEAYTEAERYDDALTLCLKALPIYENFFGSSSFEVAVLRRLMAMIYDDLEDYENLLNQHTIIRPILVKLGKMKEVASLDLSSGNALMSLDRFKDATLKYKEVVNETKETSRFHAHALVMLGKAYAHLKQNKNAVKFCKRAFDALKGKKMALEAATSLMELGSVYQQLNEIEQALTVLKKAFTIFEQHPDQVAAIAEIEGQIGLLYIFMGKVEEGVPYLESSGTKSEEIYGEDSEELLAVYNHTAIAYLELGRLDEALVKFEAARSIAVENLGPEDSDTIAIYSNLSNTYSGLERFDKAIECQSHVVDALKKGKTSYEVSLQEAEEKLKEYKVKAQSARSIESGKAT
ncbi:hypothetical protein GOP47_0004161 [Adiantum capillus-veneris]|uniref:Uncharacterized protein n=1 Tax=Adiantum capillus-veneris TaxID=13818 RepID=A0A9D4ZMC1_ADICA|nr:hypothetical protein GOP47_0004161 [Adiantum capillus-veneris]